MQASRKLTNRVSNVTSEYECASAKAAKYASVEELGPTPAWVMSWRQADSTRSGPAAEDQPPIGTQLREGLPCLDDSPRSSSHYIGIRQQTNQAHLGYPTEGDGSDRLYSELIARRHVVNVALSGERDPVSEMAPERSAPRLSSPPEMQTQFRIVS